jgi:hypothetical protein
MYAVMYQPDTNREERHFAEFDADDNVVFHRTEAGADAALVRVARGRGMPDDESPAVWGFGVLPDPPEPRSRGFVIVD